MTLMEAIKHCEDVADYDCFTDEQRKCSEEHRQLADWLRELKERREKEVTGDLISRQTALSTIEANQGTLNKRKVMKILEGLPSAEKAQLSGEDATFDCISRQDAIDAFWKLDVELRPSAMDAVVDTLKSLPSAESEKAYTKADYIMALHKEYGCTLTMAEEAHNKVLEYLRSKARMKG